VAGSGTAPSLRRAGVARQAFNFGMASSDDHTGLVMKPQEEDGALRISVNGAFMSGNHNTVLGDAEVPASGRTYWEVKIVKKPTDAWEYIGVAEPNADVTVPLTRNKNGAGWFWGSTWTDSFMYTYLKIEPKWNEEMVRMGKATAAQAPNIGMPLKDAEAQVAAYTKDLWKVPGTHVGQIQDYHPTFTDGMVIGVDVDMNDGSLGFWADGKFLGLVKDTYGKPVDLKGKKIVPALTIYGRNTGMVKQSTVMEVRTGLEPPARP